MDRQILWSFMFLLTGAVGQSVKYPDPVCAVKGSTVTLPCSFTSLQYKAHSNGLDFLQIIRVRWCQNHEICQGTTPSVYDSQPQNNNNPRYRYLGDLKENCTLQIRDVQEEDDAVLRFRMEANHSSGHFTEKSGVRVTVTEGSPLRVNSSSVDLQTVTLHCTSDCTFHPLEVTWFKDGRALAASGPALQLGPLTAKDSGNYSCALKTIAATRSQPFTLLVEKGGSGENLLTAAVVLGVLMPLCVVILIFFIFRRRQKAAVKEQRAAGDEAHQLPDNIYSSILQPSGPTRQAQPFETHQVPDDVNYASIQFMHTKQTRREGEEDAVIYTSVATRG